MRRAAPRQRRPCHRRARDRGLALAAAGCGATATTSGGPSGAASHEPGPPGLDWATADVERPAGMDATPPSIPPVGAGGGLGHPGHFASQGNPYDVAAIGDRLVAVGYTFPDFVPVTWTTTDPNRHHWTLAGLPASSDGVFAYAIATGATSGPTAGRVAIVGRDNNDAAAWTSSDGASWEPAGGGSALVETPATGMSAVVAGPDGFIAGGWAGALNQPGAPRFWASPDGRTWTRLSSANAGSDGRVQSIAAGPGGFVAVGTVGPVGHPTTSAVWTSSDGVDWRRIPDGPTLAKGAMASVTAGGPGYVAVGSALGLEGRPRLALRGRPDVGAGAGRRTRSRTTASGSRWRTSSPGPDQLVAVGHFLFGQQFGQGTAWTSTRRADLDADARRGVVRPGRAAGRDPRRLRLCRDRHGRRAGQLHPDGLAQPVEPLTDPARAGPDR